MLVGTGGIAQFGQTEPKPHFWIIIADFGDQVLAVNLSTVRDKPYEDYACVFRAGEYPKVTHRSFIFYAYARLLKKESVRKKRFKPIDPKMFAKVIAGAMKSEYFDPKYKHLL